MNNCKFIGAVGLILLVALLGRDVRAEGVLSLGGTIWRDGNNDGLYENGESGIGGVRLNVYVDSDGDGAYSPGVDVFAGTVDSADNGDYLFTGLDEGRYVVQVVASNFSVGVLSGLGSSLGVVSADSNTQNDDNGTQLIVGINSHGVVSSYIDLRAGEEPTDDGDNDANTNLTVDFGFVGGGVQIGDRVWFDLNGNGIQDTAESGEVGIPDVHMILEDSQGNRTTQITGVDGVYQFTELAEGNYTVTVDTSTLPENVDQTYDPDGVLNHSYTLFVGNEGVFSADFGYGSILSLGGTVWNDLDANGVLGGSQVLLKDVHIELYIDRDGNGVISAADELVTTTTTDNNGQYLFTNLISNEYIVLLDERNFTATGPLAALTGITIPGGDPDNNNPSDSNGEIARSFGIYSRAISLSVGDEPDDNGNRNQTVSFGLLPTAQITAVTLRHVTIPASIGHIIWVTVMGLLTFSVVGVALRPRLKP